MSEALYDSRELPIGLVAAGYEAVAAGEEFTRTWMRQGQTYTSTEWLRNYRGAAEAVFDAAATPFQAVAATGPFEVRVFGSLPEYRPRRGVACIFSGLTLTAARRTAYIESHRDQNHYALVYREATGERISF